MKYTELPVYSQKQRILDALKTHQVIVVESPTGSGKTTQLPVILHEAGYAENGIIGVTQPRRIAAVGVSRFIARQLNSELGKYVGYKMRFEDITGPETRLKILTDGTLLQEMKGDRFLSRYSVLMIDEAHERTLNIDFILGLLKDILPQRPDLKVIISSATLNPRAFSEYFDNAPIVSIDTPVFPVTMHYTPPPVEGDEDVLISTITATVEKIVSGGEYSAAAARPGGGRQGAQTHAAAQTEAASQGGAAAAPRRHGGGREEEAQAADQKKGAASSWATEQAAAHAPAQKEAAASQTTAPSPAAAQKKGSAGSRAAEQATTQAGAAGSQTAAPGDILIFCTGERMIKDTVTRLSSCSVSRRLHIMPLYGRLGSEEQEKVFNPAPEGLTKVVVSTNVAETSVTIDGITAVIDTGLAKMNFYNPRTYSSSLVETSISRASADQRRGRAGRTQPGQCFRLYSEKNYKQREEFTREEIYRTDLAEVVLRMAEIGIRDFEDFPFISPPNDKGLQGAVEALRLLDALDADNGLTDIGLRMTPYPLMPRHARMIVEAILRYQDVLREVIIAAAFLSTNSPFLLPQGEEMEARKAHHSFRSKLFGDFASYLNLYWDYVDSADKEAFTDRYYLDKKIMDELMAITAQLEEITSRAGVPIGEGGSTENFIKACARGLLPFVCVKDGRFDYRSVAMDRIMIHPGSVLFRENPSFIVAGEIVKTSQTYARSVSPLKKEWLADIHPELPGKLLKKPSGRKERPARGGVSKDGGRDSTNNIWIAGKAYPISRSPGKGNRKRVVFEWKELHSTLKSAEAAQSVFDFGSLRGTLLMGRSEILPDSKVNTILKAAATLNPKKDIRNTAPRGNFHIHKDSHRNKLISELNNLICVVPGGKKSKKGAAGFTALYSDGKGHYWFKAIRSFHGAVTTTLESLEDLADHVEDDLNKEQTRALGNAYRKVEALL